MGGYLNEGLGWRSTFWFLSIFALCIWLGILLILPETKRPSTEPVKTTEGKEGGSPKTASNQQEQKKLNINALLGPLQLFRFPNITLAVAFVGIM